MRVFGICVGTLLRARRWPRWSDIARHGHQICATLSLVVSQHHTGHILISCFVHAHTNDVRQMEQTQFANSKAHSKDDVPF